FRHRLTERNGGGLDWLIAVGAVGRTAILLEAVLDPWQIVGAAAADAPRIGRVAMQLNDVVGCEAGSLVQIIDVLGDNRGNLAGAVERGQRTMAAPRLCRGKRRLHRKAAPP